MVSRLLRLSRYSRHLPEGGSMAENTVDTPDWSKIPAPVDDRAAAHLSSTKLPSISLPATDGRTVDLSRLHGRTVVYAYPRTGKPGIKNPEGWDQIPGARGCTPQSCSFRDHFEELKSLGVDFIFGLSTQSTAYQQEAADRLHLPFAILSDEQLMFASAMRVPVFQTSGMTLLKRMTLMIKDGVIEHVFYPVFPPDEDAANVIAWLKAKTNSSR
jgi:peroxiredoxin